MAIENYHASVQKWDEILSFCESIPGGKKRKDWDIYGGIFLGYSFTSQEFAVRYVGRCGYCTEFMNLTDYCCELCPLYPDICPEENSLLDKIYDHFEETDRITPKTIRLVQHMLAEVKKHKDRF